MQPNFEVTDLIVSVSHPTVVFVVVVVFKPSILWMVLWMFQVVPTQSGQLLECLCLMALRFPRAQGQVTCSRRAAQAILGLSWLPQGWKPRWNIRTSFSIMYDYLTDNSGHEETFFSRGEDFYLSQNRHVVVVNYVKNKST